METGLVEGGVGMGSGVSNANEMGLGKPADEGAVGALVRAAADGDQPAWAALVERFSGLVWAVARAHRLSRADAADVSQTTWMRLVEHLGDIRDPERVGAWLSATARHECLRVIRKSGRAVPTELGDHVADAAAEVEFELEARLDAAQHQEALWAAFERLPERGRALLRVLMADPAPSYAEAAAALGMPIGSLGPTRARCLERLRNSPELAALAGELTGSVA
ncbi:MAG TPA: sigma-70 family RNA polymerase sigma factor [Acidimicrobiales bacterium]|nr:sigma-70 family RNA polymerase sigma factor [Acidimicrobiales bacterium]